MESEIRLFVGNLPENTTQKDLQVVFSSYGNITNLDLKSKPEDGECKKNFAFITLSTSNSAVESCIHHFSLHTYKGNKLYVTRARESFLERLERERKEQKTIPVDKTTKYATGNLIINIGDKLTPRNRKVSDSDNQKNGTIHKNANKHKTKPVGDASVGGRFESDEKKQDADKKRLDSIRQKRMEFKKKQNIIKSGFQGIDVTQNKKLMFSDDELSRPAPYKSKKTDLTHRKETKTPKPNLFDEIDGSGDEVTFDIKQKYEGKKGQKVLDLQSRYKSDKRFVLDERFLDDESEEDNVKVQSLEVNNENVELGSIEEKAKQLNILEDVLGVAIRKPVSETTVNKKIKTKIGMVRFDPTQPEHAKFLAPAEEKQENMKKTKKRKIEKADETSPKIQADVPMPEVSKEQFYKVTETLKEAIAQPTSFSLRSLFQNREEDSTTEEKEQETDYIPLEVPKDLKKVRNPLDPGEKNPFRYDSSDSEDEDSKEMEQEPSPESTEVKAVWKENLFFVNNDQRLKDGLAFFNRTCDGDTQKDRRELKFLMKKRIYNKERKNKMFQKKIGGRKSMKKSYRKKTSRVGN